MSYFNNIKSYDDLKAQYRKLAMKNHPDMGGSVEIMQDINNEYDALFVIWKRRSNVQTKETAASTRSEFYTQNGWKGTNYNRNTSLKDIAKIVRNYVKLQYPTFRFSIRTHYASMCQELTVYLTEAPFDIIKPESDYNEEQKTKAWRKRREGFDAPVFYRDDVQAMFADIDSFVRSYNREDCDSMIDYFNVDFYYFGVQVADGEHPIKIVPRTARIGNANYRDKGITVSNSKPQDCTEQLKTDYTYTITEDTDTRDNSKIWLVKINEKLSKDEYITVNKQIKTIGGYYSRFKKGFIFKDDPLAKLETFFGNTEQNHVEATNENQEQQTEEITPQYYEINEQMAKTSRSMWSMSDYIPNSETESYKNAVNRVYDIVKQIAEQKPEQLAKALTLAERYSHKLADWKNKEFRISMMCPSVMISGAGNFPVRKKEKQNRAEDKHMEEFQYINAIPEQIQNLLSAWHRDVISSGDDNALEQLKDKLSKLQEQREQIKAENKQLKAKGEPIYAAYILQNLGQNIRNVEQRIEQLEKVKTKPTSDITEQYNTTVCKVIENTDIMRLQLIFDGKPSADIRDMLKSHAFRWSPSNEAWQRPLTNNAKYETKSLLKEIETYEQQEEQTA